LGIDVAFPIRSSPEVCENESTSTVAAEQMKSKSKSCYHHRSLTTNSVSYVGRTLVCIDRLAEVNLIAVIPHTPSEKFSRYHRETTSHAKSRMPVELHNILFFIPWYIGIDFTNLEPQLLEEIVAARRLLLAGDVLLVQVLVLEDLLKALLDINLSLSTGKVGLIDCLL